MFVSRLCASVQARTFELLRIGTFYAFIDSVISSSILGVKVII